MVPAESRAKHCSRHMPAPLALAIQEAAEKCEFWTRSLIWFSEASILKVELLHKVTHTWVLGGSGCCLPSGVLGCGTNKETTS